MFCVLFSGDGEHICSPPTLTTRFLTRAEDVEHKQIQACAKKALDECWLRMAIRSKEINPLQHFEL